MVSGKWVHAMAFLACAPFLQVLKLQCCRIAAPYASKFGNPQLGEACARRMQKTLDFGLELHPSE